VLVIFFFAFRGREAGMIGGGLHVVSGLGPREAGSRVIDGEAGKTNKGPLSRASLVHE
jgi:hypothetical protein